jgi:multidrug efflux pump subunit AcrB
MGGLAGTFFQPLGLAYVAAIMMSLPVALTVTPALCLMLLGNSSTDVRRDAPLARYLHRLYETSFRGREHWAGQCAQRH